VENAGQRDYRNSPHQCLVHPLPRGKGLQNGLRRARSSSGTVAARCGCPWTRVRSRLWIGIQERKAWEANASVMKAPICAGRWRLRAIASGLAWVAATLLGVTCLGFQNNSATTASADQNSIEVEFLTFAPGCRRYARTSSFALADRPFMGTHCPITGSGVRTRTLVNYDPHLSSCLSG